MSVILKRLLLSRTPCNSLRRYPILSLAHSPRRNGLRYSASTAATSAAASHLRSSPAPIALRPYQEECIQSVLAALQKGHRRLGVSLATGAGKTVIFTSLISRVPAAAAASRDGKASGPRATQTLILAHRRELVEQAAHQCQRAYPDATIEIEMGAMHASGLADVTVASVQSIAGIRAAGGTVPDRLAKFDPRRFKLVLVDEAHHVVAGAYMRVLRHFGLDKPPPPAGQADGPGPEPNGAGVADPPAHLSVGAATPALVGVSATLSRFDGLGLGAAIDQVVYHKDYVDLIGERWLSDVVFTTVSSSADISRVKPGANGDFATSDLSRAVNTDAVNEITVRSWLARARRKPPTPPLNQDAIGPNASEQNEGITKHGVEAGGDAWRRSTLVFCVDIAHVRDLAAAFRSHGVNAQFVTGSTPRAQRASILEAFRAGEFPVLLNCGVFTEGTDIPAVDCVVLARPTRSRNLLVQMIGRGMRLAEGKRNCHVIDMVGSLAAGVVTTPTLFGLHPSEMLDEAGVKDLRARKEVADTAAVRLDLEQQAEERVPTKVTFTEYDSILDLISDTGGEKHIRSLSQNAWVQVSPGRFILSGLTGTYLRIEAEHDTASDRTTGNPTLSYRAFEIRALPPSTMKKTKSPYAAPRELLKVTTLADAVHGADSYAGKIFPHTFIHRHQRWRRGPATEGQLAFLNKVMGNRDTAANDSEVGSTEANDDANGSNPVAGSQLLTETDLTRGQAADMITKIKHGARGRFAEIEAERRRVARKTLLIQQERERREREVVTVGPLAA